MALGCWPLGYRAACMRVSPMPGPDSKAWLTGPGPEDGPVPVGAPGAGMAGPMLLPRPCWSAILIDAGPIGGAGAAPGRNAAVGMGVGRGVVPVPEVRAGCMSARDASAPSWSIAEALAPTSLSSLWLRGAGRVSVAVRVTWCAVRAEMALAGDGVGVPPAANPSSDLNRPALGCSAAELPLAAAAITEPRLPLQDL